ncbi:MAG: peptidyl-dipeptidase Dcp [Geothrix sp.]|nr:peptidyl-dipeptidase Dcp [Geothrix sp.]
MPWIRRPLFIASAWTLCACALAAAATPPGTPFMKPSPLPYHAPQFDQIHDGDYLPAIEAGMKAQLARIRKIADNPAAPTFENTFVAMERAGTLLNRATKVFFAITQANTNPALQKVEAEVAPKLAGHNDEIYLNAKLFARVKAVYEQRAHLKLGPEGRELVERYYRDFVHAGAQLAAADQTALRALNQEESKLTTEFQNRLLAATKEGALVVADRASLKGLSDGEIDAAATAAQARGLEGKFLLPLQNTTQQPALASLADRSVRERLFKASVDRADQGHAQDTRALVLRLAQLRAEKARLFGYKDYASYALADQMAKTPEAAERLMTSLVPAATAKARAEAAKMQALIDGEKGGFPLAAWDWSYYAERVRKAEFDLDESQIKPYFELDRVLREGVFYAANQLYGLTFQERHDLPTYQPDVRVFEVFDADKKPFALFYADYFKRDNKAGGAWMDSFVDQSGLLRTKPVVFNVCNFTKPAPGQPALLSFDDVTTLFHEFGHALHGLFSNVKYPTLAGTNVPRDFVEFPSQFNENWALHPQVFAHYAKHYKTHEPMPQALVDRIKAARTFNQGYALTEYLASALLDMAWHTQSAGAPAKDVSAFEASALDRFRIHLAEVPPRYHTTYFAHIWSGGYSAGYYAYLWSEVLDHDAYAWFKAHGDLTRANGDRFRKMILSRGSTEDMATLYRAFRGQDPSVEPLIEARGMQAAPAK